MKALGTFLCFVAALGATLSVSAGAQEHPLKSELQTLTDRVDLLLGGKRSDDHKNRTTLRLKGDQLIAEHQKPKHTFHTNVVTKIAALERWQAKIQNWATQEEDKIENKIKEEFWPHQEKKEYQSSLEQSGGGLDSKHAPTGQSNWKFSLDKNVSFQLPKHWELSAIGRVRNEFMWGKLFHTFYQEIGWSLKNLWSADAEMESSIQLSPSVLFTFVNGYNWAITQNQFATHHGPSLRHPISETSVLTGGFNIGTIVVAGEWKAVSYSLASTYRQIFPKQNLYVQVSPALDFLKESNYTGSASLMLTLGAEI